MGFTKWRDWDSFSQLVFFEHQPYVPFWGLWVCKQQTYSLPSGSVTSTTRPRDGDYFHPRVLGESSEKMVSKMAHGIRVVFQEHYRYWHGGWSEDWRQQRWEAPQWQREEITEGRLGRTKPRERFGSYFRGRFQKYIWKNLILFYNPLDVGYED